MRIIAKRTLREFWLQYPDAEGPLLAWYREAEAADWASPAEVKAQYRNASFVGGNRVSALLPPSGKARATTSRNTGSGNLTGA